MTAALFLGLLTNALPQALALGLILELFWIDALRLGTVVPPSATLSFLLLFPLCHHFSWLSPEQLPLPLLLCILFAHVAAGLERWHRVRNTALDARFELWLEHPSAPMALSPERIMLRSHWRVLWSSLVLYMLCFVVVYVVFAYLMRHNIFPVFPHVSWSILYGVGLLGAVLALRTRRAYIVLALSLVLVFTFSGM